jgi:citrate synthase
MQRLFRTPVYNFSASLKERVRAIVPRKQKELSDIKTQYGNLELGKVTLGQTIGGMRGYKALFCDTSLCDPYSGILFKGYSIPQCKEFLPKVRTENSQDLEPLPEGMFWLLMTEEIPSRGNYENLHKEWNERGKLSDKVVSYILSLPKEMHAMTMLSSVILYLQQDSVFVKIYNEGKTHKKEFWGYFYEDAMDLIAKIPRVAAIIYRHKYKVIKSPNS